MATYRRMIRRFDVGPDTVGDLVYSDGDLIGMNDGKTAVALKQVWAFGRLGYPTTPAGISVKTPAVAGNLIATYEFAEFDTIEPTDPMVPASTTDVRGRLHDGTTEYWWTGGAWTAVTTPATDWNTLEEVSMNLPSWDASLALGFVFELSTTSETLTPSLRGVKVLYQMDLVSFHNDWLYTTLVAQMADNIRPRADMLTVSDGTSTIDLGAIEADLESAWVITGINAVFNETTDPAHRNDILASFDTGTRLITLVSLPPSVTLGDKLLIRFLYAPIVAVTTDSDFTEIGDSPAILFEEVVWEDAGEAAVPSDIVNVFPDPPVGVILPAPRRQHLAVTLAVTAPGAVNLRRLAESVTAFLQDRRTITTPTDGRAAYLRIVNTFGSSPLPDQSGLHSATMGFRLEDVYVWLRDAVETTGVQRVVLEIPLGPVTVTIPVGGV